MRDASPILGAPSKLPSKKIMPILAVCVVIVGIVSIVAFYNPKPSSAPQPSAALAVVNAATANGLAQAVYQKIQAELTQLATSTASSSGSAEINTPSGGATTTPLTATEVLSQEFINEYLTAKQSGQQITADDAQSLIPDLIANGDVTNYIPQATVYTAQNLTVGQDNSAAAFHAYGNAVGAVFIKNKVPANLNELDIVQAAVNSGNPNDLANLAIMVASYNGIVNGLLKVSVPSQAAVLHLSMINDFSQALNSVEGMQKLFTDPVTAVSAIENYETISPAVYNDISALGPLFVKYGVTFGPNEAGATLIAQ